MSRRMISYLLVLLSLLVLSGCAREKEIEVEAVTTLSRDQEVSDYEIRLVEGQALAVRVTAFNRGRRKPNWSVKPKDTSSLVGVYKTTKERVFVIAGHTAGSTEIEFKIRDIHYARLRVVVEERDEWTPSDDEFVFTDGMGGSGGSIEMGGAGGATD